MPVEYKKNLLSTWKNLSTMKKLIWAYFILLFIEGALRKWILHPLAAPLLLVRDPISFWIIWEGYRTRRWPQEWTVPVAMLTVVLVSLSVFQMVVSQTPWFVVIYGLRSYLMPFPVAFIIGASLDRDDVLKFGKWMLLFVIPTVILEVFQYRASPDSWLNAGAASGISGKGGQIIYVGDHVRAAGTFSYVAGPMFFLPLAAAFIFYGFVNEEFSKNRKWLLWLSAAAIVLAIPVTGSRTMIFMLAATLLCVGVSSMLGVAQFSRTLKIILPLILVAVLVSFLPVFSESSKTLNDRFEGANGAEGSSEGSIISRTLSPVVDALSNVTEESGWSGQGIGIGANAIAMLILGKMYFMAPEYEFPRVLFEMGPLVGSAYMLFCYVLALALLVKGLQRARELDPLVWLMVPVTFSCLTQGVLEQPTEQGFLVLSIGLSLAALKKVVVVDSEVREPLVRVRRLPGRIRTLPRY
jgi:hypothetical protein